MGLLVVLRRLVDRLERGECVLEFIRQEPLVQRTPAGPREDPEREVWSLTVRKVGHDEPGS